MPRRWTARRPLSEAAAEPEEPASRAVTEGVVVIDFGSQYSHLIARRIRELNVYSEIAPASASWDSIAHLNPRGVVLSGGPASVYETGAPQVPSWVLERQLPVLGICYGMQALAHQFGGRVTPGHKQEYGSAVLHQNRADSPLFHGLPPSFQVWMSHGDRVESLPSGFDALAFTENSPVAAMGYQDRIFGLQFHPEVNHTPLGKTILENFLFRACGCQENWTPGAFLSDSIAQVQEQVQDGKVICALSGGVDSAVTAALLHQAIGSQLTCIFVNNGLLRLEEAERVQDTFNRNLGSEPDLPGCHGTLSVPAGGRHRPGGQAQGDWRGVHPGIRGDGFPLGTDRLPGPGNPLSRRD